MGGGGGGQPLDSALSPTSCLPTELGPTKLPQPREPWGNLQEEQVQRPPRKGQCGALGCSGVRSRPGACREKAGFYSHYGASAEAKAAEETSAKAEAGGRVTPGVHIMIRSRTFSHRRVLARQDAPERSPHSLPE